MFHREQPLSHFPLLLFFLLLSIFSTAQRSSDFTGVWTGEAKFQNKTISAIRLELTDSDKKHVYGRIIFAAPDNLQNILRTDMASLDFDQQKAIAFCHLSLPGAEECGGYLILKRDPKDSLRLAVTFQTSKDCKSMEIVVRKEVPSDPPLQLASGGGAAKPVPPSVTNKPASAASAVPEPPVTKTDTIATAKNPETITSAAKPASPSSLVVTTQPNSIAINKKDVTQSTDKDFKWHDWAKAPKELVAAAHLIHVNNSRAASPDKLLIDDITEYLQDSTCRVRVAAIDLDGDGMFGLALSLSGFPWCGTLGCTYCFYENGGLKTVEFINDYGPAPSKNRIAAANGAFYTLQTNSRLHVDADDMTRLFSYAVPADTRPVAATPLAVPSNLLGGSTPDALGRLLLQALQTNNIKLWERCIHPTYDMTTFPGRRQFEIDQFAKIRAALEEKGITDWKKVVFRRVEIDACQTCAPPGEKFLAQLFVQFWYNGQAQWGQINFAPVMTYKGKYFACHASSTDLFTYKGR